MSNCEIGSEFWDVPMTDIINHLLPSRVNWYLSGRVALQAIIQELKGCRTVALPSWCCHTMIKPFVDAGMEVHFYPVYFNESLIQDVRQDCDVILILDYFGYTRSFPNLDSFQGVVIRDVTHSIFSQTYNDAHYYFGSLRKWCGIWTGGYAWSQNGSSLCEGIGDDTGYSLLREHAMQKKEEYINGTHREKKYLEVFSHAEDQLENIGIVRANQRDVEIASKIDVEYIRTRRRENSMILIQSLKGWLIFSELKKEDCPMFVPIIVPDGKRNALRNHLIDNEIYCPVHWPVSEFHKLTSEERYIYENELSLVCDQRYTTADMLRMVDCIRIVCCDVGQGGNSVVT